MKKTILVAAGAARGLFAMPLFSNAQTGRAVLGFPQIAFEAPNDQGIKALAEEIKADHKKAIKEAVDPIREMAERAIGMAEKGDKLGESLKGDIDEALKKMNATVDEVTTDFEQKMARIGSGQGEQEPTIGQQFVDDERVKAFATSGKSSGQVDMRTKATITSATSNAAGSAGAGVQVTRLPGVLELPQRRLTVNDLLSQGRMDGNSLEYVQETGFVNNAAPVAEGAAKPGSDLQFALKNTSAKVIAHWMKASRQILDDFSQLRSIIDQRLVYGLGFVREAQLLNGDGTGQNLLGIMPQATDYAVPAGLTAPTPTTSIDVLRIAMLQAALAEYPATGHVLNPIDWAGIELTKDGEGRYIIANPQGTVQPTLWGLPVVSTQAMAAGTFLTGAFRLGAQVFDRWDARVELGFVNDDFTKNLVTILAEERLALAVYRPEAFITGPIAPDETP